MHIVHQSVVVRLSSVEMVATLYDSPTPTGSCFERLTPLKNILRVLIVDDDAVARIALQRTLKQTSFKTVFSEVVDADSALRAVSTQAYDFIFLDFNLPGRDGLELTLDIRSQGIQIPIIVLNGQGDEQTAVELMKAGASDYLPKNKLSANVLARQMRSAIKVYKAEMLAEKADKKLREKNIVLENKNRELEKQRQYIYRQNLKLQEVSRLKSEFLAMMSHELRTPLNSIIGFSQILLCKSKGPLAASQKSMLSRILANGQNLLDLINDILTFSKLEAGRLDIAPTRMDVAQFAKRTTEELRSLATQKSLALKVDIELTDPNITNDTVRLRQILVNLLSNAIKFTDKGFVHVRVFDLNADTEDSREIVLTVTDTGCGMTAEQQKVIFDPFHQADQRLNRDHKGTGLGLAITQSLVKMMGGNITAESEVGVGSTFRVQIPAKVNPTDKASEVGELSSQ